MYVKLFLVVTILSVLCYGDECVTHLAGSGYQCRGSPKDNQDPTRTEQSQFCCGLVNGVFMDKRGTCHTQYSLKYIDCCKSHQLFVGMGADTLKRCYRAYDCPK
ncbi:hypothetical protein BCR42DRAFT_410273 [Absidia repens]|uniref:Uncharacterized protein n=1 Tax=Absidia repens TaxID=90262 RepID=A0A1X2INT2_9FUNG|nr:hypothetical protein BCR42DRAFT_410273 [Absidia repens]